MCRQRAATCLGATVAAVARPLPGPSAVGERPPAAGGSLAGPSCPAALRHRYGRRHGPRVDAAPLDVAPPTGSSPTSTASKSTGSARDGCRRWRDVMALHCQLAS
ncbi:hypothetical protein ZWY2020_026624 [Hordeum vulgare]|nr:hypothetical protein ZWY2020_026624 [Hordeum vulgare]